MPGLRERGRENYPWTPSTSPHRQPRGLDSTRIWKNCRISHPRAQRPNSPACPSLSDAFLCFFFFFYFRIRAPASSEWLTPSPLLALGVDSFRIVVNWYFRSPWQPPGTLSPEDCASKGPRGDKTSGWESTPSSLFLCCHIQAGLLFRREVRLVGRKDCPGS